MSGPGTRANEVRAALLTMLTTLEDEETGVFDSALGGRAAKRKNIFVATTIEANPSDQVRMAGRYGETLTISNLMRVWSGSKSLDTRWDDASALFDRIEALVMEDRTLGETCDVARLGPWQANPESDQDGSALEVEFAIITRRDG